MKSNFIYCDQNYSQRKLSLRLALPFKRMKLIKSIAVLALALLQETVDAATEKEKEAFPEYAQWIGYSGLDWEPHEVKTEDGWYLTIFRIKPPAEADKDPSKLPIMTVHGSMDSAAGYMNRSSEGEAWCLQMAKKGYEIWLNNSRGVKYSQKHERDGEISLKEKWDFSWADMGYYDLPASIKLIQEVTGAPKVTVVGHSQGTSQMWYALAKR